MFRYRYSIEQLVESVSVFLYFFAVLFASQIDGIITSIIWYSALGVNFLVIIIFYKKLVNKSCCIFALILIISGLLNYICVGNTGIREQILLLAMLFVSMVLVNGHIDKTIVLLVIYINIIVILYKFITVGFSGQIIKGSSSNFISVYLLLPTVVYYSISKQNEKTSIIPAILIWILSLFARGRGGIISTSFLLIGLLLTKYWKSGFYIKLICASFGIIIVSFAALNYQRIINLLNESVITEYFRGRGMQSSRIEVWDDYLEHTLTNVKSILFGTDLHDTIAAREFSGNPHNSFLNIHIYNGFFMLLFVTIVLIKNIFWGLRNKRYVFCICMIAIMFRAFTDNMFWPAYGTPVLFFFLFYPHTFSKKGITESILLNNRNLNR